jgi:hypothetical protein
MYQGFNLTINEVDSEKLKDNNFVYNDYIIYKENNLIVEKIIDFVNDDGTLSASKIAENFFPQIETDIFLSHSHNDKELAINLASWLLENFELKTFIDSCVWGYVDELLSNIDNKYCLNNNRRTYNYKLRNLSTSHVHMILAVALSKIIDNTECVFFLNTPHSIKPKDTITKTFSPWIYYEIVMTHLIRKKTKYKHRLSQTKIERLSEATQKFLVNYDIDLTHLIDINFSDLSKWQTNYKDNKDKHPLDVLYLQFADRKF